MPGPSEGAESERLRGVLDTANDAFVAIDSRGSIIDWNPQAERTFGYRREEAIGRRLADTLIPERYRDAHHAGLKRFMRTGEGPVLYQTVELAALRRSGEEFPIELTIWPTTFRGTVSFNAFVRDITERVRVQGFVRLLRTIAVAANEAHTSEDAFRACLREVCMLTGWPVGHVYVRTPGSDELSPTSIWYLSDPEKFERFRRITEATPLALGVGLPGRVVPDGKPAWVTDVTRDDNFPRARAATDIGVAGGFAFPVLVGAEVVAVLEFFSDSPKEPDPGLLEVMSDIGTQLGRVVERERGYNALQQAFELLRAAEEMKDIFLEGVSHELRTPLSVVLGTASLLVEHGDRIPREQVADLMRRLRSGAFKLEHALSDLLDLHRLTRGVLEPRRQTTDVAQVVARAVGDRAEQRPLEIDVDQLHATVDAGQVQRIISNLLDNAIRHTPPATAIWIRAARDDGLHLVVEDAGPGVPDAMKERIFEPFVRGNANDPKPGTGIGLSIVSRFAQLHGGRAWVEDRPGGGASFHVRIPEG